MPSQKEADGFSPILAICYSLFFIHCVYIALIEVLLIELSFMNKQNWTKLIV